MSYDCSIIRYSADFSTQLPIQQVEWEALVDGKADIRFASLWKVNDTLEVVATVEVLPPAVSNGGGLLRRLRNLLSKRQGLPMARRSSQQVESWVPVLSLAEGEASFPNAVFGQEAVLDAVLSLADSLQACIIGQDGEVYFVPGIGPTWDEYREGGTLFISVDEVRQFRRKHGSNYGQAAQQQMRQRGW